jgi:hypothetical protein
LSLKKLKDLIIDSHTSIKKNILGEIIKKREIDLSLDYYFSTRTLGEYVTLDIAHRAEILKIKYDIRKYYEDNTLYRPLNMIMFAPPGSGKSHFVKCLAKSIKNAPIGSVVYNMATMQNLEDLILPLEEARNQKVIDRLPILFLDEFDSSDNNYAYLLPLLWDGSIRIANRDIRMGKIIIILAASKDYVINKVKEAKDFTINPRNNNSKIKSDKNTSNLEKDNDNKLIDLISRINGNILNIPELDLSTGNIDRRVDKICIAISILKNRFNNKLSFVPWSLLRFIALTNFKYGVRSINHLIDIIPNEKRENEEILNIDDLKLPVETQTKLNNSSLAYHILAVKKEEHPCYIWEKISSINTLVRIKSEQEEEELE